MCFIGEMPVWEHLGKPEEARRVSDLDEGMNPLKNRGKEEI